MLDVNQFRAAIERGSISDLFVIIKGSIDLDERLASVSDDPPLEFQYHNLHTARCSDIVFGGIYHVYYDLLTANLWNAIRVFRILLHQKIRETLLQGFSSKPPRLNRPEYTAGFQRSTDLCYKLQAEILASVPQHLGYVKRTGAWERSAPSQSKDPDRDGVTASPSSPSSTSAFASVDVVRACCTTDSTPQWGDDTTVKAHAVPQHVISDVPEPIASGGYNLIWPLWFVGAMDMSTEEIQLYAIKNLRRIGDVMGIQQAFLLAKVIETKAEMEVWNETTRFEVLEEE